MHRRRDPTAHDQLDLDVVHLDPELCHDHDHEDDEPQRRLDALEYQVQERFQRPSDEEPYLNDVEGCADEGDAQDCECEADYGDRVSLLGCGKRGKCKGGKGESYGSMTVVATQISKAMRMHMKRSWIVQKGMRTDFNQGDDFRVVAFAIAAADGPANRNKKDLDK